MATKSKTISFAGLIGKYLRRYTWHVIGCLVAIALFLFLGGMTSIVFGFSEYKDKLFDVAGMLGGAGTALASVKAYWTQIKRKYAQIKIQHSSNHVVVCGLGEKGMHMVETFLSMDIPYTVVVIESRTDHPESAGCWERGVVVITGDAADSAILAAANTSRAKFLCAVTGSDDTNIEIARKAREVVTQATNNDGDDLFLRCFCHVAGASNRDIFSRHDLFEKTHDGYDASMFSVYDSAARFTIERFPPDKYAIEQGLKNQPLRIVVIGFGKMGEALINQAARIGHYLQWPTVEITVVEKNLKAASDRYLATFGDGNTPPAFIVPGVSIRFVDRDPATIGSLQEFMGDDGCPVVVYLAIDDDPLAVSLALRIRGMLGSKKTPMVCCMKSPLSKLMEKEEFPFMRERDIYAFNMLDYACTAPVLLEEVIDEMARSIHSAYVISLITFSEADFTKGASADFLARIIRDVPGLQRQITAASDPLHELNRILGTPNLYDQIKTKLTFDLPPPTAKLLTAVGNLRTHQTEELSTPQKELLLRFNAALMVLVWPEACPDKVTDNSSLTSWRELTEDKKDSNRWQADHLWVKLRALGFTRADDNSLEQALTDQVLVHGLSEMEHRRWSAALLMDGWRYGPGKKDGLLKTHPCLVPYEQLPENEKAKDATMIHNIRNLVKSRGWNTYIRHIEEA